MNDVPAIPAATLILMRDGAGAPEILMMERSRGMAFAAGAMVFPGGRIDPEDRTLAEALGGDADEAAARIAAIRETIEEAGIAPALTPEPPLETISAMRSALHAGAALDELLRAHGLELDLARLVPFARWRPNFKETRRFDARFYIASASTQAPEPSAHADEAVRVLWTTAQGVLDAVERGHARAIFPTLRNLERLAQFRSFEEARAQALDHPVRTITPWVEEREGEPWLCIPTGAGYPVTAERLATVRRR